MKILEGYLPIRVELKNNIVDYNGDNRVGTCSLFALALSLIPGRVPECMIIPGATLLCALAAGGPGIKRAGPA